MAKTKALADTGFFIALIDKEKAPTKYEKSNDWLTSVKKREIKLIVPYPILYETINTRLYKKNHHVIFKDIWLELDSM